jgi:lipopolysaccharide/colanic/teichoic acid biosynthesis glycosyltransferase
MNLIIIHKNSSDGTGDGLLRFALSHERLASLVLKGLSRRLRPGHEGGRSTKLDFGETVYAIPGEWRTAPGPDRRQDQEGRPSFLDSRPDVAYYGQEVPAASELVAKIRRKKFSDLWFVVSNGRFATQIDTELLEAALARVGADVVAATAEPELLGDGERVRLTAEGNVAGFRRMYSDWAEFAFISADWPDHLFIRANVLPRLAADGCLSQSFSSFAAKCRCERLTLRAISVGGTVLDLETEEGLLALCGETLSQPHGAGTTMRDSSTVSGNPRIIGPVLFGEDVRVGSDAIIIGPALISDGVEIEQQAVIYSSIIGPGVRVPGNTLVRNRVIKGPQYNWNRAGRPSNGRPSGNHSSSCNSSSARAARSSFRQWGRFSYARCLKRIADCLVAVLVLILFAPIMPFVALAIRLTSPGPAFYKDKRQGLHGREFNCLKFRTMITGAHAIQEKLRAVSQVDGPQFKMADDPRISTVGRFLRETYIDEIPQFFNVLLGQMSVVGPRPSPESENTLCPFWRDARLSVRPGITGLWQIRRTREPMKDFQEWIQYDVEYVRNLSLRMDLRICWLTTKKLLDNFISQF